MQILLSNVFTAMNKPVANLTNKNEIINIASRFHVAKRYNVVDMERNTLVLPNATPPALGIISFPH